MTRTSDRPSGSLPSPRNCLGSCVSVVLVLGVFGVLLAAAWYAFDALLGAPWAYPLGGRSTLTGIWVGETTLPSGTRFALELSLRRARFLAYGSLETDAPAEGLMAGEARWCDDHGRQADTLTLEGEVPMLSGGGGTASAIAIDLDSARRPQPGLQPAYFNSGVWQTDTLTLTPTYIFYDAEKQALVSSSDDPDLHTPPDIVLKKSDPAAFAAACSALSR